MASRPYKCRLLLAGALITLDSFGELLPPLTAASARSRNEGKPPLVEPIALGESGPAMLPKAAATEPSKSELVKSVAGRSQSKTSSNRAQRKTLRHQKAGGRIRAPVVVQSRLNLSYYGILERPQRYEASRDRRTGRAPNPQAGELLHDHFQELDKNRDGLIDPFERAMRRLDIDRDLTNRQRE